MKKKLFFWFLFMGCIFFMNNDSVYAAKTKYCKISYIDDQVEATNYIIFNNYDPYKIMIYQDKVMQQTNSPFVFDKNGTYKCETDFCFYDNVKFINGSLSFDADGFISTCPTSVEVEYKSITFNLAPDGGHLVVDDDEDIPDEYGDQGVPSPKPDKKPVSHFDPCVLTIQVLRWVRMLVPIIIILLSSMDFFKAVFANEDDAMKKAYSRLMKRIFIAAIIFLVPTLLEWLIKGALPEIFGKDWFVDWCPSLK